MILGYCRVSTDEQAADGTTSLKIQERKCKALATMRGASAYDFVSYVDAGVSGSLALSERPNGRKLLEDAKEGDFIVANKLDRIFRSASDALMTVEQLAKRKIGLILLDVGVEPINDSGISKLFFAVLSAVAEFERGRIAERMNDGRKAKKERGGCIGGEPYGFKKIGRGKESMLEPIPEEIEALKKIAVWKRHWAPATIRRKLNNAGIKPRSGKDWDLTQVRRLMNRAPELLQRIGA